MKIDKDKISHPSHPHKLKIEYTKTVFKCDGCKEDGIGPKYKCDECEFDLHKTCALAPSTFRHSFCPCKLGFHNKPPGTVSRTCNACTKDVLGFVYHCSCDFDLHPLCAYLPEVLDYGETKLHLCKKLSRSCLCCEKKGRGWSYRSKCNKYNFHVACVKKLQVDGNKKVGEGVIETRIPKGTLIKNHHKEKKGKLRKYCEIVAAAVRIIISAILGDPTAIIAAALASVISN